MPTDSVHLSFFLVPEQKAKQKLKGFPRGGDSHTLLGRGVKLSEQG